jgi:O-antigen/teichoic acid export membrane protein
MRRSVERGVMDGSATAPDASPTQEPTIGGADATRVAAASLVAAASSYVVLALAARRLSVTDNTVFVTFWSTLFACFGVLSGVSIETTRSVTASAATSVLPVDVARRPRVLSVGLTVAAIVALVLAPTAAWWGPLVFPTHGVTLGLLVAAGAAAYALHSVVVGALAGTRRWRTYAWLIGGDSLVRLALVAAAAAAGLALTGYAAGATLACLTWLGFLLAASARAAVRTRADAGAGTVARRLGAASVATGASALLVVGFPVLLSLTTTADAYAGAAPLLLAISLTRAPLMIPLNAYQGVAVSHFVAHRDRGLRALAPIARVVLGVGAAGAVLAFLIGPWLMVVLLGPGYDVAGGTLAELTVAATELALLTLTGALCQSLTRHGAFVGGWLVALFVAVVVLLLPFGLTARAVLALCVGPAAGIAVHLTALSRRGPR